MALASGPVTQEISARHPKPPRASDQVKKDKNNGASHHAAKSGSQPPRASRSRENPIAQKATGAHQVRGNDIYVPPPSLTKKKARTAIPISANRKSISLSPPKRPNPPDLIDSPTEGQLGPTLNEEGPLLASLTIFFPMGNRLISPMTLIILSAQPWKSNCERLNAISTGPSWAGMTSLNLRVRTSSPPLNSFWQCGLASTDELKRARRPNRSFTLEDLRKAGTSAKDLNLPTGLFRLFHPPAQKQPGGGEETSPNVVSPIITWITR